MIIRTFFGWEKEDQVINNEEDVWFIEQLSNTWDDSQKNNTTNTTWLDTKITNTIETQQWNTVSKPEYIEIKLMMPHYFYTSGRKKFAEDLYDNQKIYINFIFIDDLNLYKKNLSNPDFSESDIFLFPYDWKEIVPTRPFSFQQNIQWSFDELISPIINSGSVSFLPFSADPMIMYSTVELAQESTNSIQNNFSEIYNLVYSREPNIQLAFPIFFWITSEDYNDKWFLWEYQDIVRYALLHYFKRYKDSKSLWIWNTTNILEGSNETRNYNTSDLNLISNIITQPECKYFPSICFQIYNFVGVRFWFLSDIDIAQQYFSYKKSNFEKIFKMKMPFFTIESPVRVRWRWIANNLEDIDTINSIYKFLSKYMNDNNKYNLRSSTLSVFKKDWFPLSDNQYIWIRWYILETWWDYMNTLRKTNIFRQLLEHQISEENYLQKQS